MGYAISDPDTPTCIRRGKGLAGFGTGRRVSHWARRGVGSVTLRVLAVRRRRCVMAVHVLPVQVGDVELLVETVTVSGTEKTSRASDAAKGVVDAFGAAEAAISALCERVAGMVSSTTAHASKPSSLVVEFGLKFSAKGQVIVAGASAEASLKVTVSYESERQG